MEGRSQRRRRRQRTIPDYIRFRAVKRADEDVDEYDRPVVVGPRGKFPRIFEETSGDLPAARVVSKRGRPQFFPEDDEYQEPPRVHPRGGLALVEPSRSRLLRGAVKHSWFDVGETMAGTGTIPLIDGANVCVGTVARGTAVNQRIGNEIVLRRVEWEGQVSFARIGTGLHSGDHLRLLLVHDKSFHGIVPPVWRILGDGNGSTYSDGYHFPNPDEASRFSILWDEIVHCAPHSLSPYVQVTQSGIVGDPIVSTVEPSRGTYDAPLRGGLDLHLPLRYNDNSGEDDTNLVGGALFFLCYGVIQDISEETIEAYYHIHCEFSDC